MPTDRAHMLQSLYLKILYSLEEEKKEPKPSQAVIVACNAAKSAIYREYEAIMKHRATQH
jgi:hypothetical protein